MSADSSVLGQFEAALAAADWLCESDLAAVECAVCMRVCWMKIRVGRCRMLGVCFYRG